jgi:glycosyltransferase involved in cell wall biosynthesis
MLKLSLIIPVYNEERHIRGCLDAVSKQSLMPAQVILVDNNCSDRTLEIAEQYDFVTIIKESMQGRGHARTAGFNYASGDILGRIDADSRIDPDWCESVAERFERDHELAGITGMARTDLLPIISSIKSTLLTRTYYWFAHAGFNTVTMWGANMALRKSAWLKVAEDVCLDDRKVHEDQDVSLWVAANGGKIVQDNQIKITTNGQTYRYLPKLLHYMRLYESTKSFHKKNGNLDNPKTPKIGFFKTLPGRIGASISAVFMLCIGVLFFPIDLVALYVFKSKTWFD